MKVWGICASISVTIAYIWTKFYIELKHRTIDMKECCKFTWLENPRRWRPPSWISENVNNSELDRAICAKFGGLLHHGHAQMTHDQNSKPELFLRDVIVMINKDVLYWTNVGNIIGALMSRPTRALNLQIFSLSLCRTHLFALLSRLLICDTHLTY